MSLAANTPDRIDLAHLVCALVSTREPSRGLDKVIHAMIGGREPLATASHTDIRLATWIEDIPPYTMGGRSVAALARRLGVGIGVEPCDGGFLARVWGADGTFSVVAPTEGGAACAALARFAASGRDAVAFGLAGAGGDSLDVGRFADADRVIGDAPCGLGRASRRSRQNAEGELHHLLPSGRQCDQNPHLVSLDESSCIQALR